MNLKEIGEFGFIERFKPLFSHLVTAGETGIGDDCAIIAANETEEWLITTDLLIEEVHFLRNGITPEQLGHKALAVNLSDIAAMGGTPVGSFLSIAVPAEVEVEYLDAFMKGYHALSSKYGTPLLGGDTTRSMKHLAINVAVIGKCPKGMARKRSMAREGDVVCVTGHLGDSAGGLQVLLNRPTPEKDHEYLLARHHLPEPRLKEGAFLAGDKAVHAMIDISDGIASDLRHVLKASGVAALLQLDKLPLSDQLIRVSGKEGWNALELAIGGGEDYELLFTISANRLKAMQNRFRQQFGTCFYPIGTIVAGSPDIKWIRERKEVILSQMGFNHFQ